MLRFAADEKYEFVPLEWLQKWLDESTPAKPIDNSKYQCAHSKLHPDKISHMKRISEFSAEVFYQRYGGGPRLKGEHLANPAYHLYLSYKPFIVYRSFSHHALLSGRGDRSL